MPIQSILILGGGSAGLMAALTLKKKIPQVRVTVVRSPDIGIIGVGEGTTATFPRHFFEYLRMPPESFYRQAEPTWKLGIKFLWGPRRYFYYTFAFEYQHQLKEMSRNNGFYFNDQMPWAGRTSAYMEHDKCFPRKADGSPQFHNNHAFHIENHRLASWLESECRAIGVEFRETTVEIEKGGAGIAALITPEGQRLTADLYVDASGFRAELVGKALEEPFVDYSDTLFCDRAVIGGWARDREPIRPYTVAETMDSGWCWQIEHETFINRGYVYSSSFTSDEEAKEEFLRKNPKAPKEPRIVPFRSGRLRRNWVGNVVAVGNAAGFVEPLEATALQVISVEVSSLADGLLDSGGEPTPSLKKVYNHYNAAQWDDIRDFLAVHYKFNTRVDTPYWRACRNDTPLHGAEDLVDFYLENGPSILAGSVLLHQTNSFGIDGYLAMLVGQDVPHKRRIEISEQERQTWSQFLRRCAKDAVDRGMGVQEALDSIRGPAVKWA